jgi:hypothetical protein
MLLPTATFVGYLVGLLRRFRPAMYAAGGLVLVLAAGLNVFLLRQHDVATFNEGAQTSLTDTDQARIATFFKGHYSGGRVLMDSFGNEDVVFEVPSSELVYEGSYQQWLPALQHPAGSHISWIIARCGSHPDEVCRSVTKARLSGYDLVYQFPDRPNSLYYYVYKLQT